MDLSRANSKARSAVKRREELIEQEELEGGEINLVPYLDVVTNLMLFVLATLSTSHLLGQLNTLLPDSAPAASTQDPQAQPENEDKPLGIKINLVNDGIVLMLPKKDEGDGKTVDTVEMFDKFQGKDAQGNPTTELDWERLNKTLYDLAAQFRGKARPYQTYRLILIANPNTPYSSIVKAMDAARCKFQTDAQGKRLRKLCVLPALAEDAAGKPVLQDGKKLIVAPAVGKDPAKPLGPYDPDTMALFHLVSFGKYVAR